MVVYFALLLINFCEWCEKMLKFAIFLVYQPFDDSIEKEVGRKGGEEARVSRIIVWC